MICQKCFFNVSSNGNKIILSQDNLINLPLFYSTRFRYPDNSKYRLIAVFVRWGNSYEIVVYLREYLPHSNYFTFITFSLKVNYDQKVNSPNVPVQTLFRLVKIFTHTYTLHIHITSVGDVLEAKTGPVQ